MSDKRQLTSGGLATGRKPRLVFVGGVGGGAAGKVAEQLRKLDWDVFAVQADEEIACTVLARRPSVVVIPVETGWETGYLLAAKLRKAKPRLKVVLVAPTRTVDAERFAKFVGATLVAEGEGTAKLVTAVRG
jgi:hypothetical protein